MVVGGIAINMLGSVVPLQRATTVQEFGERAVEAGQNVRLAGLIDIVGFVPGYLLLGTVVFAILRSRFGHVALIGAAIADQTENVIIQVALRSFDGTNPPTPASATISILRIANTMKWVLAAAVAILIFVGSIGRWRASRSTNHA